MQTASSGWFYLCCFHQQSTLDLCKFYHAARLNTVLLFLHFSVVYCGKKRWEVHFMESFVSFHSVQPCADRYLVHLRHSGSSRQRPVPRSAVQPRITATRSTAPSGRKRTACFTCSTASLSDLSLHTCYIATDLPYHLRHRHRGGTFFILSLTKAGTIVPD